MANLNKVMIIGNLTADPEVRTTPSGTSLTELRMAVNRQVASRDGGERREETTFLDVTCWGRVGEIAAQYLSKGRPVFIEGRLQMDSWEDKQTGQKRSRIRIIAENLQLLGGRDGGGNAGGTSYQSRGNGGGGYGNNNGNGGGYNNNGGGAYNNAPRSNNFSGGYQGGNAGSAPSGPPPSMPADDMDDIPF